MAKITALPEDDEIKTRSKSKTNGTSRTAAAKKTPPARTSSLVQPSATPIIVLAVLSFIIGISIHVKAIHLTPDQSMGKMMKMSSDDFRKHLGLSKSWPGTRFFDDYAPGAMQYFLLLISAFKEICVDITGRGLLLLVSTCIAPFCCFLAIESLKDGRSAIMSAVTLVAVTTLGQIICIGAAMPLVMGPLYAYSRWSEVKTPEYVQPSPSPSKQRVGAALLCSVAAISTFFPTIFIPVNQKEWILANVAFQFFPLGWIPLIFFSTKKTVVSETASASAREQPRLSAANAYQLLAYFNVVIYYVSIYYGFQGFKSAFNKRGYWANDGHHVLFWDGIGCLAFDYIVVLIDSYVDEAKIQRGATRAHHKRFLPEDFIMGLPGIVLFGPGWAMSTYFQRREILAEKTRFGNVTKDE